MSRLTDKIYNTQVPGDPAVGGDDFTYGRIAKDDYPTWEEEAREREGQLTGNRDPKGFGEKAIDLLLRGQYFSMAVIDGLLDEDAYSFTESWKRGFKELIDPEARLSMSDVIKHHATDFAERNPKTTAVLGFIGDVALDPTTYLSLGQGAGAKIGIRATSATAKAAAKPGSKGILRILQRASRKAGDNVLQPDVMRRLNKAGMEEVSNVAKSLLDEGSRFTQAGLEKRATIARELVGKGFDKGTAIEMASNRVRQLQHVGEAQYKFSGKAFEGFVEKMTPTMAFQTAERRVAQSINLLPELAEKYLDKGGMRWFGAKLSSGVPFARIADATGLSALKEGIKDSFVGTTIRRTFSQADLPQDFRNLWKAHVAATEEAEKEIKLWIRDHMGHLSEESRNKIGGLAHKIDDETTRAYKKLQVEFEERQVAKQKYLDSLDGPPDPFIIDTLDAQPFLDAPALRTRLVDEANLSAEEHSALVSFWGQMAKFGRLEQEQKMLKKLRMNYSPRYYDLIGDAPGMSRVRQTLHRFNEGMQFGPGETRKFQSLEQASKMGYSPVTDAGVLYALRAAEHHNAMNNKIFRNAADGMVEQLEKKMKKHGHDVDPRKYKANLDRIEHLKRYIKYVGEGLYNEFSEKEVQAGLRAYDWSMRAFRTFATVARPAFGVRQIFSNHFQNFIGAGKNGIKHLYDPRATFDAGVMMGGMMRGGEVKAKGAIRSVFGVRYTYQDIMDLAKQHDVLRNISVDGVGHEPLWGLRGAKKFMRDLDRHVKISGRFGESAAGKGMAMGMEKAMKYMYFPAFVEDFSRLSMFNNLLRAGHSPQRAAGMVDEALFDYLHGLSIVEQRYVRRIIPFYSFQRFAVPLLGKATAKTPGRVANAVKGGKMLMEVFGKIHTNDNLTDAERTVLPGWLIEQPHVFAGFNEEMEARFKTFNNYSPLDVFGFMQATDTGDIDIQESLSHAFLAQLTPLVKVPMEFMVGNDFFTGRALDDARNLGDIDVDKLLGNLLGMAVGAGSPQTGLVGIGGGMILGEILSKAPISVGKQTLGRLMGMEEGIDQKTGKRQVYVNAYAVHVLTSMLPGLQDAFKVARNDKTPMEKTQQFLFGVPTTKLNLTDQRRYKVRNFQSGVNDAKYEMRKAAITQRMEAYADAQMDLQQWIQDWQTEVNIMQTGEIRGAKYPAWSKADDEE